MAQESTLKKRDFENEFATDNYPKSHYIIGIGASAGGLEALKTFFDHVPANFPHSFVIVQHLSPDYKSLMTELLAKNTSMPIYEAEENMLVRPGCVFLVPPQKNITISQRRLHLTEKPIRQILNLPIDIFFHSLAHDQGSQAVGIILSGTGSDGSRGIRAIKDVGGVVFVQRPDDARFDGMPNSAIATGLVDYVLAGEEIPGELLNIIRYFQDEDLGYMPELKPEVLDRILERLHRYTDLNFNCYRRPTLLRRVARRMGINRCTTAEDYEAFVKANPQEMLILSREFLIGVTQFFRDQDAWRILEEQVLPKLIESKSDKQVLKVWSVGCSTGEEAYSLAILIQEQLEKANKQLDVKIFATDLEQHHIAKAAQGCYSENSVQSISPERLKRFFIKRKEGGYKIIDGIRKLVIFSQHNAIDSPPLIKMDIVTCRNLLIYLEPSVQKKLIGALHYALNLNGYLFLGASETLADYASVFEIVSSKWRIYRNQQAAHFLKSRELNNAGLFTGFPYRTPEAWLAAKRAVTDNRLAEILNDALLAQFGAASVFVEEQLDILHAIGNYKQFLELPDNKFSVNLLELLPDNLRGTLTAMVYKAARTKQAVMHRSLKLAREGSELKINLLVKPLEIESEVRPKFLIVFLKDESSLADAARAIAECTANGSSTDDITCKRLNELEYELKEARENLRSTIEEVETSNEELQSTNEELLSSNEELQSTNEELQSVNEELHTVNTEHQQKIEDLAGLNADMENLLRSTGIATIFLDKDLRIRRFTPAICDHFDLLEQDIGRSIEHFSTYIGNNKISQYAREVIETGKPNHEEIQDPQGRWYLKHTYPFINSKNEVDGVVICFVDISSQKQTESTLRKRTNELECSNMALEQFAYAASHDLQEPLNTISNFVGLWQNQYADQEDEKSRLYLNYTVNATARMKALISALLDYSRLHVKELALEKIESGQIIDEVLSDLQSEIELSGAVIHRVHCPVVQGNPTMLRQLFQNLISNALKFKRQNVPPQITVSATRKSEFWEFAVSDNGIGVEEQHQQMIFDIFKRLHTRSEYEGTGLGLALCRKVVELHGGEIYMKSTVGEGSTFLFSLPDRPE